jgi:serine/threonine protein kinase
MSSSQANTITRTLGSSKSPVQITKEDPEKLYQLVEIIGTGSYGEVFKVHSIILGIEQIIPSDIIWIRADTWLRGS